MNDVSQDAPNDMPLQSSADENRLTADDYDDFLDALDLLYLRGNLSARLKFFENWPIAAHYIFGDELIAFDRNGTTDTERRAALEDAAEDKRLELLELVATLEEKSVEKNVLQAEYVEQTIKMLGRDLSLLMYATKFVDRYCPDTSPVAPPLDDVVVDQPVNTSAGVSSPAVKVSPDPGDVPDSFDTPGVQPVKVKPVIEPLADDALDGIQPISVEPQGVKTVSETPLTTRDADPVSQVEGSVESSPVQQSTAPEHSVETSVSVNPVAPVSSSSGSVSVASPVSPPPPLPAEKVPSPASIDQQSATPVQQELAQAVPPSPPPSDPTIQDATQQAKHKALGDSAPIASQKMTFVPSQPKSDSPVQAVASVASVEAKPQPNNLSDPLEAKRDDGDGEPPASA